MNLKKIFFRKKYEEEQMKQEEQTLQKERNEEKYKIREIFYKKSIDKIPEGENPRDFVRIGYSVSMHCPNEPDLAYGRIDPPFGPYFLTLKNTISFGSKDNYHSGEKFIRILELPVSLEKLVEDADSYRENIEGTLCCKNAKALLATNISAGDRGLLFLQANEKIKDIKNKKRHVSLYLPSLANLYSRIGKEDISKELKKHYENLILNREKTSSLELIGTRNFSSEKCQKNIFYKEFKKIQEYNSEIEKLARERDSKLCELKAEVKGSYSPEVTPSLLTEDSMKRLREEIIERYDPTIREFYRKIKEEGWKEKVDSIKELETKYENSRELINKKEYKTLYRAARLDSRQK